MEKEEGEGQQDGRTYYDVVRVEGDNGNGNGLGRGLLLGGDGNGNGKEPPPTAASGEAEAALMPLPKINPALFIAEGDIVVGPRVRAFFGFGLGFGFFGRVLWGRGCVRFLGGLVGACVYAWGRDACTPHT